MLIARAMVRRQTERWLDAIGNRERRLPRGARRADFLRAWIQSDGMRDQGGRGLTVNELSTELDASEAKLARLVGEEFDPKLPWEDYEEDDE